MEYVTLSNGVKMPKLGFGVFLMNEPGEAEQAVTNALKTGYRLIDTASRYYNEEEVGAALKKSSIPREELFITTKLWFKDAGYENTKRAFEVSLEKLGLDYLDLYLIHQPFNDYYGSWRAMEELYKEGKIRAIGVSNFYPDRLKDLVMHNEIAPMIDQRETHPMNQQWEAEEWMKQDGVQLEAWSPLGRGNKEIFTNSILMKIADNHQKSVAQIILRWFMQRNIVTIPKASHVERMQENFDIFDFVLSHEEMELIKGLDQKTSIGGVLHNDPKMLDVLSQFE
ncbi:aldo/keto reductase [Enterococcus sp. HY326]|uniref:aldo/keto reductase n=1 Tax=Enterococcus sp. HY326 TaxID=2971265 RepID=UPI00223EB4B0|nr:aldo/keto reductase [Enterococcus sp. HY326]